MVKNYFKITIRSLLKNKVYSVLNIVGLSVGIAAMVWGYQTYRFAFSFDDFHRDQDHVYRALTYKSGAEKVKGVFPMVAVHTAEKAIAGIAEAVRLDSRIINVKASQSDPFTERVHFTDPDFFKLFHFPLIAGTADLSDVSSVLLTERLAKKYFGTENPIDKTLIFYAGESYAMPLTVKGVVKDVPVNSTIQFDLLTSFENIRKPDGTKIRSDDWSEFVEAAFFKIPNGADVSSVTAKLKSYLLLQNAAREDWKATSFQLLSLRQSASLSHYIDSNSLFERPDDAAAFGPIVLAFLIFLTACLNFANITVARSGQRLKEIGLRKVMGSTHGQLMVQLLLESAAIVIAAAVLSVLLNSWWFPAFKHMFVYVDVRADYLHDMPLLAFLGSLILITSLLAGAYPAFYISRFNASSIFRGTVKFGGSNLFSKVMLGLQLAIALITVIAGMAFARNAEFQRTYDFGYNVENTIGVLLNNAKNFNAFKNEVSKIPQVTAVAGTKDHIGFGYKNAIAEAEGSKKETNYFEVGSDYLAAMRLKTIVGRPFDIKMESDYTNKVLISQNMAALYGWKDPDAIGKQIRIDSAAYSVIGVLKDFHSNTLFEPFRPVAMKLVKEDNFRFLIIQAKAKDLSLVYDKTKQAWQKLFPLTPFSGFYQNQVTAETYRVSSSIATVFFWFAIISILLAVTGLFALVSLTVLKKMKEIALRKVVGASSRHILVLINKGYFWIFLVASVVGCYCGWTLTKLTLDMIFKINAGVEKTTLAGSVITLFIIAAITIGIKVWQAILTNPIKFLRNE